MTQRERVLSALRHAGDRGLTQVDFIRYPTFDGGPPITRLAARIEELRDEGFSIFGKGIRDRSKVYVLSEPASAPAEVSPPTPVAADALFEVPARELTFDEFCPRPRNAALEDWDAA